MITGTTHMEPEEDVENGVQQHYIGLLEDILTDSKYKFELGANFDYEDCIEAVSSIFSRMDTRELPCSVGQYATQGSVIGLDLYELAVYFAELTHISIYDAAGLKQEDFPPNYIKSIQSVCNESLNLLMQTREDKQIKERHNILDEDLENCIDEMQRTSLNICEYIDVAAALEKRIISDNREAESKAEAEYRKESSSRIEWIRKNYSKQNIINVRSELMFGASLALIDAILKGDKNLIMQSLGTVSSAIGDYSDFATFRFREVPYNPNIAFSVDFKGSRFMKAILRYVGKSNPERYGLFKSCVRESGIIRSKKYMPAK